MENENKDMTIEQSFAELDKIIDSMQNGSLSLQETFDLYKKGVELVAGCNQKIDKIQCDIEVISKMQKGKSDGSEDTSGPC